MGVVRITAISFALLLCASVGLTHGGDDSIKPPATPPSAKAQDAVTKPSRVGKFARDKDGFITLNDQPFFVPKWDEFGEPVGFQNTITDMELDHSMIADKLIPIGSQAWQPYSHRVALNVVEPSVTYYVSPDGIVVSSQNADIALDGPFISLAMYTWDGDKAKPLPTLIVEATQGQRKWSGKSDAPVALDHVTVTPIKCRATDATGTAFDFTIYPRFRGGQPGLVSYRVYH